MPSPPDINARILETPDIVLVGSGIMSATLAVMLKRIDPPVHPDVRNHSRTGAGSLKQVEQWARDTPYCELSYTPARDQNDGVLITRALHIFEQFQHSKQFWGSATAEGMVGTAADSSMRCRTSAREGSGRRGLLARTSHRDGGASFLPQHDVHDGFFDDPAVGSAGDGRPRCSSSRGHLRCRHGSGLSSVPPFLRLAGAADLRHRRRLEGDETQARGRGVASRPSMHGFR